MSDNPFESPVPVAASVVPTIPGIVKAPSGLSAIAIICIILGVMGMFGSCLGVAAIGGSGYFQGFQQSTGDEALDEFQQKMNTMQEGQKIPNMVVAGLNILVGGLLLIGGIGIQTRKGWGGKLLSLGLLVAAVYCLIRLVVGVFMQVSSLGPLNEALATLAESGSDAGEMMGPFVNIMVYGGIAYATVLGLGLMGFYLWSWSHMKKPHIVSYLATFK